MSQLLLTYHDFGTPQEPGTAKFNGGDMTAATFDIIAAEMAALANAVDAITLGVRSKTERRVDVVDVAPIQPASPFAQRETKWLVRYRGDTTGNKYWCEIPCADLALLDVTTHERADMSNAAMVNFKATFETFVKGDGGEDVTITDVAFVSKNL